MFNFFLDWRDIRPDASNFMDLTPTEMATAGLLPDVADQMRMVTGIYALAKDLRGQNYRYCFRGLAQYVRLGMKGATMSEAEWAVAEDSATGSSRFAAELEVKERLERVLDHPTWDFDCPFCNGVKSVVTELDDGQLELRNIVTGRCACAACGFFAREGEPYLSGSVLEKQIASSAPAIFKALGING
jgi:transcription elongation factor Elf1